MDASMRQRALRRKAGLPDDQWGDMMDLASSDAEGGVNEAQKKVALSRLGSLDLAGDDAEIASPIPSMAAIRTMQRAERNRNADPEMDAAKDGFYARLRAPMPQTDPVADEPEASDGPAEEANEPQGLPRRISGITPAMRGDHGALLARVAEMSKANRRPQRADAPPDGAPQGVPMTHEGGQNPQFSAEQRWDERVHESGDLRLPSRSYNPVPDTDPQDGLVDAAGAQERENQRAQTAAEQRWNEPVSIEGERVPSAPQTEDHPSITGRDPFDWRVGDETKQPAAQARRVVARQPSEPSDPFNGLRQARMGAALQKLKDTPRGVLPGDEPAPLAADNAPPAPVATPAGAAAGMDEKIAAPPLLTPKGPDASAIATQNSRDVGQSMLDKVRGLRASRDAANDWSFIPRAGEKIRTSWLGGKPDNSVVDGLVANANKAVTNVGLDAASDAKVAASDPNSDVSKRALMAYRKSMPNVAWPDGASKSELDEIRKGIKTTEEVKAIAAKRAIDEAKAPTIKPQADATLALTNAKKDDITTDNERAAEKDKFIRDNMQAGAMRADAEAAWREFDATRRATEANRHNKAMESKPSGGAAGGAGGGDRKLLTAAQFGVSEDALNQDADRYNLTGQEPTGQGNAGYKILVKNRAAERRASSATPVDPIGNAADFAANRKALDTMMRAKAQIGSFEGTTRKNLQTAIDASDDPTGTGRTRFPLANALLQAADRATGGTTPGVLKNAIGTAIAEYVKIMSSGNGVAGGMTTDRAAAEGQKMLNESMSPAQIKANIGLMIRDMENRITSLNEAISEIESKTRGPASGGSADLVTPEPSVDGAMTMTKGGRTATFPKNRIADAEKKGWVLTP